MIPGVFAELGIEPSLKGGGELKEFRDKVNLCTFGKFSTVQRLGM